MPKLNDRTGERYGRLVVLKRGPDKILKSGRKVVQWECLCDCGNTTLVTTTSLGGGLTKSCGCLNDEKRKDPKIKHHTHGHRNERIYEIWHGMKARCYNPSSDSYNNYGFRGITVCEEWKNNFQNFYDWAIKNGYQDNLSLDRKDNNLGYSPENCRWITQKEQQRNKRNNRLLTYKGETHCLAEWEEITGINRSTISTRIDKLGWTIEKALTELPHH